MVRAPARRPAPARGERGQIIVIAAFGIIGLIAVAALVLEGGNAYAQQRVVQNGADATANAGAVALARKLGGTPTTDADVLAAMNVIAAGNRLDTVTGRYTDVTGQYVDSSGTVVASAANAAVVGAGTIPATAQGVAADASRSFGTILGRAVGINGFTASASATAVTGRLTGGRFLPVVFPVSIVDCDTNGSLGSVPADRWQISQPGTPPAGTEYIVPLCKTGGGSFQILDLDPSQRCDNEIANPPTINWDSFPVIVPSDNGNNCAKPITDYVNANLQGQVVTIPICDNTVGDPCGTSGGSHAEYRITRVVSFYVDYMSDTNNRNNPLCQNHTNAWGQPMVTIAGNGSSSCLVGWFIRFIDAGPVGTGTVTSTDSIGVQLIR